MIVGGAALLQSSLRSQIPDSLESKKLQIMIMLTVITTALIAGMCYAMCTNYN